jgi:flagellar FliJ protein
MSMTDTAWNRLMQFAEQKRDDRARELGALVGARNEAHDKLKLLLDYRRDYLARLDDTTRAGIDGEGLRNFRTFLAQLERAIEQQTDAMAEAQQRVSAAQAAWRNESRRIDSYQTLDDRRTEATKRSEERKAQKLTDELAARARLGFFGGDD